VSRTISRKASIALTAALVAAPRFARAQGLTQVEIGVNSNESNADAFYAKDAGVFTRNGLDVDIQVLNGGAAVAAAITGGTLQIGASNVLSLATAIARGLPFVAIAPATVAETAHATSGVVVLANGPVHSAKDLNGKVVSGISLGGIDQLGAYSFIDKYGGDSSTIKYIELPPPGVPGALEAGRISAGLVPEPLLSELLAGGKVRSLGHSYDGIGPRFMSVVFFAKRDWANANAALVKTFAASLLAGEAWADANPAAAAASLGKWTKTTVDRRRMVTGKTLDPALLQPLLDSAFKYKLLPRQMTATELIWKSP
jgi:NitT/TauT family transport system substrate-binding protein